MQFFHEEGLSVDFVSTPRGFGVAEAVSSDEADILCGNVMAVLLDTLTATADDQLVAFALLNRQCYSFVLGRRPEPFKWDNLLSRSLLVPSEYPSIWIALRHSLQVSGLPLDQTRVVMGFPALDALRYFRAGLGEYVLAAPEMAPDLHPLASIAQQLGPVPWSVYAVKKRTWASRRSELEAFYRAITRAMEWTNSQPLQQVADVLGDRFSAFDANHLAQLIGRYRAIGLWPSQPVINADDLGRWQDILIAAGLLNDRVPTDAILADGAPVL